MYLFHTRPFWSNTGVRKGVCVCVWAPHSSQHSQNRFSLIELLCLRWRRSAAATARITCMHVELYPNYWDIMQNIGHNLLSSFPFITKASSRTSKHWMGLLLWPGKHPVGCIHTMASQTHQRCEYTQWWSDQEICPKISADPQPPSRWSAHHI